MSPDLVLLKINLFVSMHFQTYSLVQKLVYFKILTSSYHCECISHETWNLRTEHSWQFSLLLCIDLHTHMLVYYYIYTFEWYKPFFQQSMKLIKAHKATGSQREEEYDRDSQLLSSRDGECHEPIRDNTSNRRHVRSVIELVKAAKKWRYSIFQY